MNTIEGNKLIAEFMGLELCSDQEEYKGFYEFNKSFNPDRLTRDRPQWMLFRNSWSWLMPVVEKICRLKIGDDRIFVAYAYPRSFGMLNEETGQIMVRFNGFSLFQADTLIETTYLAVIDFLQWKRKE